MKKPTLIDVAQEAGVSPITVSRTLRQPDLVSEAMRLKVAAAVKKLNYVPDSAAATLASNRSNIIGMLIPSFSNSVFADVLAGAYEAAKDTRFNIQIGNMQYNQEMEEAQLASFLSVKPAGLIISGIDQTPYSKALLTQAQCPVVQVMDLSDQPFDMIVGFSNADATTQALEHMIGQGFKKIGFVAARMDLRTQRRMMTYREVMQSHGLLDERLIVTTPEPSSAELGRKLFNQLLSNVPECDAGFFSNDDLAVGASFECQRKGIRIPDDFGICGFNDLGTTSQIYPEITSVHTPRFEVGKTAVEMILAAQKEPLSNEARIVDLGFELKVRASTLITH